MTARRPIAGVLVADAVSTTGTEMTAIALPWFVLVTTGSPARMAGVLAAEYLAIAVCGLPSGRLVNALGSRRTMLLADAMRAPLVGLVPVLHAFGGLSYPLLIAIGFAVGAFFPAYSSAQRGVVADAGGSDDVTVTRVGGLLGAVNESASFAGPALGGMLIAVVGASWVLAIDAATYVASFAVLAATLPAATTTPVTEPSRALDGIRWLRGERALRRQVIAVMLLVVGWTALMATLPVAARHRYHGGASLAGWLLAAYGGGSVVGGLLTTRTRSAGGRVSTVTLGVMAALAWVLVVHMPAWSVGVVVAAYGVCNGMYFPRLFTALSLRPPSALRASVMTAAQSVMSLPGPLGYLAAGLLVDGRPVTGAFVLVGAVTTMAAVVGSGYRIRR